MAEASYVEFGPAYERHTLPATMERLMSTNEYVPPKVWTHLKPNGGVFESINRPTAGATFERDLPKGKHPLQLVQPGHLERHEGHDVARGASGGGPF